MYSKLLLASTFLVASALADGHLSGGDKSSWDGGAPDWGSGGGDECCDASQGGYWGDWQPGAPNPGELIVQVISVSDANGSLKYYPDSIQAAPGSIVQFQFHPKNHTITESSFADPCKPLAANLTSDVRPGIRSGFVPVTGTEDTTPVYNILINDTKPIWIYCGQGPHCQRGMSMVINQNMSDSAKTIEKYKEAAALLPIPPAANATVPGGPPAGAPPYGGPPSGVAPSVVVASPGIGAETSSSFGGLPPPTSPVAGVTASTTAVAPSVFTGAAVRRQAVVEAGSLGLVVAGLAALL